MNEAGPANANLATLLVERAEQSPDAVALVHRGWRVTYAELARLVENGATQLWAAGLRRGDAVLVFQPVSVELYVALLAIFRLGLTAMLVDPAAGRKHLERCCRMGNPRGFVGPWQAHALRLACGALRAIPTNFLTGKSWLPWPHTSRWNFRDESGTKSPEIELVPAEHPALLTFTSGSTGQPKAAVRTHGFLRAQHRALHESLVLAPGEKDFSTLPVFVLANLASGVTSVLPDASLRRPARFDSVAVQRQIEREQPTRSAASPAFFERLLDTDVPIASLRKIYLGGAPVFPALLTRLQTAAPRAEIVSVYGSTEVEPIAKVSAREITAADLATMQAGGGLPVGRPEPSIHLRVIKDRWGQVLGSLSPDEFAALACAPGEFGEIVVCGEHVLRGYLHGQGDTETKFRVAGEVWHRTGDAGRLDAAGWLWLGGRCAAKVRDTYGTQYPLAVEAALLGTTEEIRRCAFVLASGRRCLLVEPKTAPRPWLKWVSRTRRGKLEDPSIPFGFAYLADSVHSAQDDREKESAAHPIEQRISCTQAEDWTFLKTCLPWAHVDEVRTVAAIPVDRRHNAKVDYPALKRLLRRDRLFTEPPEA